MQNLGIESIHGDVLKDMVQRDQRDQQRSDWPLRPADDAIIIDTTHFTSDDAFNLAVSYIEHSITL